MFGLASCGKGNTKRVLAHSMDCGLPASFSWSILAAIEITQLGLMVSPCDDRNRPHVPEVDLRVGPNPIVQ